MWYINGKTYDLNNFNHPGGPIALSLGKEPNKDATGLFRSYHPFSLAKAEAVLNKYEVKAAGNDAEPKSKEQLEEEAVFDWNTKSEFFEELKGIVSPILKKSGTKATWGRWGQIVALMLITWASSIPFLHGNYLALILFPLLLWMSAVNILHDATHFALSMNWRVNHYWSYMFPWFTSPFTWYHQHVIGHHIYTNIHRKDPDMHHGTYLWKYHEKARWYNWYRWQRYYVWFVWTNMMMSLAFLIDFVFFLKGNYHKVVKMMPISKNRRRLHHAVRFLTFFTIYVWPFFNPHLSWSKAFIWSVIPYGIIGYCFAFSSQLNHITGDNQGQFSKDWYKHQVMTSHTFAPDSLFWFLFTGGLNLQIEHHLFPGVNHWHLRTLQPIVYQMCKKHNVNYNLSDTAWIALKKHLDHLDQMALGPDATSKKSH